MGERIGRPRRLRCTKNDFVTIISSKAKWGAHSGVLEMHAYLLGLKWAVRHPARHHSKLPFLVDAKAVVGAATKGRSSAHALRTLLRCIAAHTLAADVLPRLVYIPSESNPADEPSRGKRKPPSARPVRKRTKQSRRGTRLERYLIELGRSYQKVKTCQISAWPLFLLPVLLRSVMEISCMVQ